MQKLHVSLCAFVLLRREFPSIHACMQGYGSTQQGVSLAG